MMDKQNHKYLIAPDEVGKMEGTSNLKKLRFIEKINVLSLDWGVNHMVVVDTKNRVYTMGLNRNGKLGVGDHNLEPESGDNSTQ
jgi:alpha-tubulin suppressor-like RCC1 family protein